MCRDYIGVGGSRSVVGTLPQAIDRLRDGQPSAVLAVVLCELSFGRRSWCPLEVATEVLAGSLVEPLETVASRSLRLTTFPLGRNWGAKPRNRLFGKEVEAPLEPLTRGNVWSG